MFFYLLKSVLISFSVFYIIYLTYSDQFRRAKRKRDLFQDNDDFLSAAKAHQSPEKTRETDQRYKLFTEFIRRQNKEVGIRLLFTLAFIFVVSLVL